MAIIREIPANVVSYVAEQRLLVLRRKRDGMALNVSLTRDGLQWTSNKLGRALMYKRAFIKNGHIVAPPGQVLEPAKDVYIEVFVPKNHDREEHQVAEYTWTRKALMLCRLNVDNF